MDERLMEKLARLGAEAGIKQMTPEINRFFMLVRADVVAQWPERPVDFGPQPDMHYGMNQDDWKALRGATDFPRAPVKLEGGIADPDEFGWECNCEACKARYKNWKAKYEAQQK